MKTMLGILFGILLLASPLLGWAELTGSPTQTNQTDAAAGPQSSADQPPTVPLSPEITPMMAEIEALLKAEAEALADLNASFQQARDETEALAVQEEISRIKVETELNILRVQIRHARAAGHEDVAVKLEAAIEKMTNPPEVREPQPRSVADGSRR